MTEPEWLGCNDPETMLTALNGKTSERKLRLFACACCRRVWHILVHPASRKAVQVAERYADGRATENALYDAYQWADDIWSLLPHAFDEDREDDSLAKLITASGIHRWAIEEAAEAPVSAAEDSDGEELLFSGACVSAAEAVGFAVGGENGDEKAVANERATQAVLLRDIIGNPSREQPAKLKKAWRTDTVLSLAKQMYKSCDFSAMPILADALQDAGCD